MDDNHRPPFHAHRPPWWPENVPWPPRRGRMRQTPFFRRMGCFFILFNLLGFTLVAVMAVFVLKAFGQTDLTYLLPWTLPVGVGGLGLLIGGVYLALRSLRRMSRPFDDLHEAAGRVADGDYSARVQEKGPPEVRSLARAFNDMASRLHQADQQRRNLLADATHELLTPLTVIQGNLEGMLDGVYPADESSLRPLLEETNILAHLIEDLRTLSLAESGALRLKKEPTDLLPFLHDVSASFQPQAANAGVTITVDVEGDLALLEIDPGRMRQVFANLLANALRYSPRGSTIRLAGKVEGKNILLTVQDEGPGIKPADLEHVFERFYKSTDSGGMGLGLAIARHLVEAHGGSISAENAEGGGTIVRIELPGVE